MNEIEVLHRPFDLETHKATFTSYLEVVISPDGIVEYAVPSHTEKIMSVLMKTTGKTREQINDECPPEYYFDFMRWLTMQSGYIMVWNEVYCGDANEKQKATLRLLKEHGLYYGLI